MDTRDFWSKRQVPVDTRPEEAKISLELLSEYGLDVPIEKWREAMRGATGMKEKVVCDADFEEKEKKLPKLQQSTTEHYIVPSTTLDALFVLTEEELLKKDRYFFAGVQHKTETVDRQLRASSALSKNDLEKRLNHYYYVPAMGDLPNDNYGVFHNSAMKVAIVIYFPANKHWFLEA